MKQIVRFILLIDVLLVLSIPATLTAQQADAIYYPAESWRTSTPEEQGMDSALLTTLFRQYPAGFEVGMIHSILVIRHGNVVVDASAYPFRTDQPHWQFSITKSVISTLIGIAIDQGLIRGVDQSIWDFFPAATTANMDARKASITIENLLTQSSGLQMSSVQDNGMYALTAADQSWVQYTLDMPMTADPGTGFNYLDANAHLLSAILQQATGMSSFDYAQANLFGPLGITDAAWRADPQGVNLGGDGLAISPYSMAKLGYLYLHQGVWNGQQIVSSAWVAAATRQHIDPAISRGRYGYLWWTDVMGTGYEHPSYAAFGYLGQGILVVPNADLVLVVTGEVGSSGSDLIRNYIMPAVMSEAALPANAEGQSALAAQVARFSVHNRVAGSPISDVAMAYSGRVYTLADNPLGWQTLSVQLSADEVVLSVEFANAHMQIPVGLDHDFRLTTDPLPTNIQWLPTGPYWRPVANIPVAARGRMVGDNGISFQALDLTGAQAWTIAITLGDTVAVEITPLHGGNPVQIQGVLQ